MFKKVFSILSVLCLSFVSTIFPNQQKQSYYCDSYSGFGEGAVSHTEVVDYESYTMEDSHLEYFFPDYEASYGSNCCAPTAGSMLITYHDVMFTELLPDYTPGSFKNGIYKYRPQNMTIGNLMVEMYNLMGTNSVQPGTSVSQFKSGMTAYYNNHGYNIGFSKVTNLSASNFKNLIEQQNPIVLFLNSYDYYASIGVSISDTQMRMVGTMKSVGHVVVAWGFRTYNYYMNGSIFKTSKFLIVSFGDGTCGYMAIENPGYIDEAYITTVS